MANILNRKWRINLTNRNDLRYCSLGELTACSFSRSSGWLRLSSNTVDFCVQLLQYFVLNTGRLDYFLYTSLSNHRMFCS